MKLLGTVTPSSLNRRKTASPKKGLSEDQKFDYSNEYFANLAPGWNKCSFTLISQYIRKGLKLFQPKNVLDLGCGNGVYYLVFKSSVEDVCGVDMSTASVKVCRSLGYSKVIQSPAEKLPFQSESFDMVFTSEVLEHVRNYKLMLQEIHRILKEGGSMVLTTTCYSTSIFTFLEVWKRNPHFKILVQEFIRYLKGYFSPRERRVFIGKWCFESLGGHFHGFIPSNLKKHLLTLGFEIVECGVFYAVEPVPFVQQNRWFEKCFAKESNWPIQKRLLILSLSIILVGLNFVFKKCHCFANNVFFIARKRAVR